MEGGVSGGMSGVPPPPNRHSVQPLPVALFGAGLPWQGTGKAKSYIFHILFVMFKLF